MTTIKDDLIQIAMQKVQESGINSLTIRELGETVGIKSSSVMYHFKSKNGLLQELIKSYRKEFGIYLEELNTKYDDQFTRLDKFIDAFEMPLKDGKFCLAGVFAAENKSLDLTTAQLTGDFFVFVEDWISLNLIGCENPKEMAGVILSSLEGAMMLDKLNENTERLDGVRRWIKSLPI